MRRLLGSLAAVAVLVLGAGPALGATGSPATTTAGKATAAPTAAAAAASSGARAIPAVTLHLASQTLLVAPNTEASFALDAAGTLPDDAELAVTVNGVLSPARAGVAKARAGEIRTPIVGFLSKPVTELTRDAAGRLLVTLPTVVRRADKTADNVRLATPGVYPVRLELRSGGNDVLARITTFLVRTTAEGDSAPAPLGVSVVLPLDSRPTLQPDGSTVVQSDDRSRLQSALEALQRDPNVPLAVQLRPDLVAALDRTGLPADRTLKEALGTAIGNRPLLSGTLVPLDASSAVRAGLRDEYTEQLRLGDDTISSALSSTQATRTTTVLDGPVDGAAVELLRDLGTRQLVLPDTALAPVTGGTDTTLLADVAVGTTTLAGSVAVADAGLGQALANPGDDPVLSAYQLLAELSAMALDAGQAGHGVVIVPPRSWQPDPVLLGTFFDGLMANRLLQPLALDELFRRVDRARDAVGQPQLRVLAAANPPDLRAFTAPLGVVRYASDSFTSMLPATDPTAAAIDSLLHTAVSTELTGAQRQAYVDAVNVTLSPLRNAIEPVPTRRVTLAGKSTDVPITIRSRLTGPTTVKVRLASPKLAFPAGDQVVTVTGSQQIRVPVEARANGTFPLTVEILTPRGDQPVASTTQLTVQVTRLTGLGVVLTGGAILVLGTWWLHHLRTTRRQRRAAASAQRHPSGSTPPPLPT